MSSPNTAAAKKKSKEKINETHVPPQEAATAADQDLGSSSSSSSPDPSHRNAGKIWTDGDKVLAMLSSDLRNSNWAACLGRSEDAIGAEVAKLKKDRVFLEKYAIVLETKAKDWKPK